MRLDLSSEMVQGRQLSKAEVKMVSANNRDNYPGQTLNLDRDETSDTFMVPPLSAILLQFG